METPLFDPFRNRLARDIRNKLSKTFLNALAVKDISELQKCGSRFLGQNPGSGYEAYVTTRMARYQEAYGVIEQNNFREVLEQAAVLWDIELYFEMHEILELEWKDAEGERRRALQGLIQAAGMKIHTENSNMKAAASMAAKALVNLQRYGYELTDFVRLESVLAAIAQTLAAVSRTTRAD